MPSSGEAKSPPKDTNNHLLVGARATNQPEDTNNYLTCPGKVVMDYQPQDTNNWGPAGGIESPQPKATNKSNFLLANMAGWSPPQIYLRIGKYLDIQTTLENLAKDTLALREDFDNIQRFLSRSDGFGIQHRSRARFKLFLGNSSFSTGTGTTSNDWDEIRKGYDHILRDSRRLTTKIAVGVEDFRRNIIQRLDDIDVPVTEKKQRLERFIEDMKEIDQSVEHTSKGLAAILKRIQTSQSSNGPNTRTPLWGAKDKAGNDKKMRVLSSQIDQLLVAIKAVAARQDQDWQELCDSLLRNEGDPPEDLFLTAIKELLGPAGFQSLMYQVISEAKGTTTEMIIPPRISQMQYDLDEKLRELRRYEGDTSALQNMIPDQIKYAESRAAEICRRLSAIENIWDVVRADARTLQESLNEIDDETSELQAALRIHPNNTRGAESYMRLNMLALEWMAIAPEYENLEKALIRFANVVA